MINKNRKNKLENNYIYHVINRSIASYQIFNTDNDYLRMIMLFCFYQRENLPTKFSMFLRQQGVQNFGFYQYFKTIVKEEKIVEIIAYCLMSNHIHLVLKQLKENGISIFMGNVLNSYTRYFNTLHKRKGPLWESKFRHILVESDEQLLHLTRYIHLNPCSANMVKKPELWQYSSYLEYLKPNNDNITSYDDLMEIDPKNYQKFVNDRKDYQRQLSIIKKIINL
ncbi:MAG: transposase [Patescibacteria group bacterium]|nr:transposase [Patescibacteria group bacterium]